MGMVTMNIKFLEVDNTLINLNNVVSIVPKSKSRRVEVHYIDGTYYNLDISFDELTIKLREMDLIKS